MKRIAIIVVAGLVAATAVSAQTWGPRGSYAPGAVAPAVAPQTQEVTTVDGKLAFVNGMIAVQTRDNKTYYVGGLQRLFGFVDGLKEGAAVKVEGYAVQIPAAPEYLHLMVTKLTFNGKDYDLSQGFGRGAGRGYGMMGGYGPAWGQDDSYGPMMGSRGGRSGRWY